MHKALPFCSKSSSPFSSTSCSLEKRYQAFASVLVVQGSFLAKWLWERVGGRDRFRVRVRGRVYMASHNPNTIVSCWPCIYICSILFPVVFELFYDVFVSPVQSSSVQ